MEEEGRNERNQAGRREFLRGAGFAACMTALGLAAAAHLCALWIAECPRETLRDRLLVGRPAQ